MCIKGMLIFKGTRVLFSKAMIEMSAIHRHSFFDHLFHASTTTHKGGPGLIRVCAYLPCRPCVCACVCL